MAKNILGISAYYHDSAAALIVAGEIVAVDGLPLTSPDASLPLRSVRRWGRGSDEHATFQLEKMAG